MVLEVPARGGKYFARTQIGTGKQGYYPASTFSGGARALHNPKLAGMANENIKRALAGSNISKYATDNSSAGLALADVYGGRHGAYGREGLKAGRFTLSDTEGANFGGSGRIGEGGVESFLSSGWGGGRAQIAAADSDRVALAECTTHKVEGTGQLDVKVSAPAGTKVNAKGAGLFKQTNVERHIQMQPASGGPLQEQSGYATPFPGVLAAKKKRAPKCGARS